LELQAQIEQEQATRRRLEERQDLMSSIRDPVLWAAFDLQSRIFNIVAQRFLFVYLVRGSAEQRNYAQRNTLFVLAQYLGWVEIVRRRVQFLDLGNNEQDRKLVNCFSKITGILSSDAFSDSMFRVFRGDQRAIGEIMIDKSAQEDLVCIGYAEFCTRMDNDQFFARWFSSLSTHIEQLATSVSAPSRLVALQGAMIDLIDILDPDLMRFPDRQRSKLPTRDIDAQNVRAHRDSEAGES
jgi:hypothetical protein